MAQKTERVSARVPERLVRDLESIMDKEGLDSISECLRECIEEYIKLKSTLTSTENIIVDIGMDILSDIDNLVDIGRVSLNLGPSCRLTSFFWEEQNIQS
jgi:hypothetical protein